MKNWFEYEVIGQTLDDAVGECFDKVARMLGLTYPGGPQISKLAGQARAANLISAIKLPRPMMQSGTCDFSFSGLKTAALYALRDKGGIQTLSTDEIAAFSRELEESIGDVLVSKATRALKETGAQTFVIGGGVAASSYLRERLQTLISELFPLVEIRLPDLAITGDNAVMIAQAALARRLSGLMDEKNADEVRAVGNLSITGSSTHP